jgi:hypothetical protein
MWPHKDAIPHHTLETLDMTKNLKNYAAARVALKKLEAQLATEAKADPRLKRGHGRIKRLLALVDTAEAKYEIVHGRRQPSKAKAKVAKKAKAKAAEPAPKAVAAAARKRAVAKRSK